MRGEGGVGGEGRRGCKNEQGHVRMESMHTIVKGTEQNLLDCLSSEHVDGAQQPRMLSDMRSRRDRADEMLSGGGSSCSPHPFCLFQAVETSSTGA